MRNLCRIRSPENGVSGDLVPDFLDLPDHLRVGRQEGAARVRVGGVQHGSIVENDLHALDGPVAVLRRSAAHAARVVGGDPPDHAMIDRRGVRADLPPVRREAGVGLGPDDPRPQRDFLPVAMENAVPPSSGQHHQDGIRHGLARQARAGGTKRDGNAQGARGPQEMRDLLRGVHLDDDFRDEAVETGVRAEGERPEGVAEDSGRRDGGGDAVMEHPVRFRERKEILFVLKRGSLHVSLPW